MLMSLEVDMYIYISTIYDKDHRELQRNTFLLVILDKLGMHIRMRLNPIL